MTVARKVDRIHRRLIGRQHAYEDPFGDQLHAVVVRKPTLDSSKFVAERWQGKLEHDEEPPWSAKFSQQLVQVALKLPRGCRAEQIVAADLQEDDSVPQR